MSTPEDGIPGEPGQPDFRLPPLLVYITLVATAVFGTRLLASYWALSLGADAAALGLIASSFAGVAGLAAIPLGRVIDRVGTRPIMIAGSLICGLTCAAMPAIESIAVLAVSQAVLGVGQLMAVVGSHTMLATQGGAGKRAGRVGIYTSAASFGIALGPWLAGQVVGDDFSRASASLAYLAAAAIAGIAAIVIATVPSTRRQRTLPTDRTRPISIPEILRRPGMVPALVASIASLVAVDLLLAYLPAYGEANAITPPTIGMLLAVLALAQISSRLVLGPILDRFGASRVLRAGLTVAGLCLPVLVLTVELPWLLAVMLLAGAGLGLAQPLTLVWVVQVMPGHSQGLAMGVRMTGNRLGQLAIPVLVGATAGRFGVSAILIAASAMLLGASAFVTSRRRSLDESNT